MACFKWLSATTGTVCSPYKEVRVQASQLSLCHLNCNNNNQWIWFIFALKIVFSTVIIQCLFPLPKTMSKCTFEMSRWLETYLHLIERLYLLGETCWLNEIAGVLEYISLTNCGHGNLTTNGIAVKQNRNFVTLLDALLILSAWCTWWIFILNKARYYIVCPFKQGKTLVSKPYIVDILYRAGSVKLRASGLIH